MAFVLAPADCAQSAAVSASNRVAQAVLSIALATSDGEGQFRAHVGSALAEIKAARKKLDEAERYLLEHGISFAQPHALDAA